MNLDIGLDVFRYLLILIGGAYIGFSIRLIQTCLTGYVRLWAYSLLGFVFAGITSLYLLLGDPPTFRLLLFPPALLVGMYAWAQERKQNRGDN